MAGDRSPAEILKELDQVKPPTFDHAKLEDDAHGRDFTSRREEAIEKRGPPSSGSFTRVRPDTRRFLHSCSSDGIP
jgi:hypothetical protein